MVKLCDRHLSFTAASRVQNIFCIFCIYFIQRRTSQQTLLGLTSTVLLQFNLIMKSSFIFVSVGRYYERGK